MRGAARITVLALLVPFLAAAETVGLATPPPRIQFLQPGDLAREFGCVGLPVGGSDAVLGWSSTLLVLKVDGVVLRFEPEKTSDFPTGEERGGDRIHQLWTSGSVSAALDLVRADDCPPGDDECDGSHWEGDLTVRARSGAEAGSSKAIRIRIDCGC